MVWTTGEGYDGGWRNNLQQVKYILLAGQKQAFSRSNTYLQQVRYYLQQVTCNLKKVRYSLQQVTVYMTCCRSDRINIYVTCSRKHLGILTCSRTSSRSDRSYVKYNFPRETFASGRQELGGKLELESRRVVQLPSPATLPMESLMCAWVYCSTLPPKAHDNISQILQVKNVYL